MTYTWSNWLKDWRMIADKSSPTEYVPIIFKVDNESFEVLRVSKFHLSHDGDIPHVETTIREFNDKTALHSKATRDLGIVRVITNNRKPAFVIEPGADVLEGLAFMQGVTVKRLLEVMRAGDLGRRVRQRDRKAAKASRAQLTAVRQELGEKLAELRSQESKLLTQLSEVAAERDSAQTDRDRMRNNLIAQNAEQHSTAKVSHRSGTKSSALGTDRAQNQKLTSIKPLPGNFEG